MLQGSSFLCLGNQVSPASSTATDSHGQLRSRKTSLLRSQVEVGESMRVFLGKKAEDSLCVWLEVLAAFHELNTYQIFYLPLVDFHIPEVGFFDNFFQF